MNGRVKLFSYFALLRPHQWLKNTFIFLPSFLDGKLMNQEFLMPSVIAFVSFCMAASCIYCFNDIYDVEADRKHPVKRWRSIASGAISKTMGYAMMMLCAVASLSVISIFPLTSVRKSQLLLIISSYIIINIAYCIKLKRFAIVDVFIIATGFVLRIFAGGVATGIYLSHWIILMTFLLALFLAFAKRRDDVVMYLETGVKARKNVNRYNLTFMNQVIGIIASITMVCYIMYTVSPEVTERLHSPFLYLTAIFVLAGIIRYLQLTIIDVKSGSPTKILMKDRFVQCCVLGWILSFGMIIYI